MIEKIMDAVVEGGRVISEKYAGIQTRWLSLVLLPIFIIFALLYTVVTLVMIFIYCIEGRIKYGITLRESFDTFKEGVMEGLDELKG